MENKQPKKQDEYNLPIKLSVNPKQVIDLSANDQGVFTDESPEVLPPRGTKTTKQHKPNKQSKRSKRISERGKLKRVSESKHYILIPVDKNLVILLLILVTFTMDFFFFNTRDISVSVPGSNVDVTKYYHHAKEVSKDVTGLSVVTYPIKSMVVYPFILYNHWEHRKDIDWYSKETFFPLLFARDSSKESKSKSHFVTSIDSDVWDTQMSSYLAINKAKGINIPYGKEVIVTAVEYEKGYNLSPSDTIMAGDNLLTIEDIEIRDNFDLNLALQLYYGKEVHVTIERNEKVTRIKTKLPKLGVLKRLTLTSQEAYEDFKQYANLGFKEYQGTSAGLATTLSYYTNNVEDITKGYKIAATGGILETGEVYPIAGVELKTLQAISEGVDVMFVPKLVEYTDHYGETVSRDNYKEALSTLTKNDASITIIGVTSLQDALDYLQNLKPKSDLKKSS